MGYTIGDKRVAQVLVEAGKKRPWIEKGTRAGMDDPAGIFSRAKIGIVAETILPSVQTSDGISPGEGKIFVLRQTPDDVPKLEQVRTPSGAFATQKVWNFSDTTFSPGELVLTITDVFNRYYVTTGKGGGGAILAKVTDSDSMTQQTGVVLADVYVNGPNEEPTGSVSVHLLNLAMYPAVPEGTWLVLHPQNQTVLPVE